MSDRWACADRYSREDGLVRLMESMRLDSAHSDLTIIRPTRSYAVHKVIVCNQSKFLDKACNSGFEETYTN